MTCIVAYKDKGRVYLGCDSISSNGFTKSIMREPKVFKKGKMLIGYTTSFRMGQIIQHDLNVPKHSKGVSIERYIVTRFIPALRKCLGEGGYNKKENERESGGTFIVIYKNRIFKIQDEYSVLETTEQFDACGSGEYAALAALKTMAEITNLDLNGKQKVEKALEVTESQVVTVSGPFTILDMKQ